MKKKDKEHFFWFGSINVSVSVLFQTLVGVSNPQPHKIRDER